MQSKAADALIGAQIKIVEELEALVVMLENINNDEGPGKLTSKLREVANMFDKLTLLANDLSVVKRRLRGMLSSDPEKTPRAVSIRDFPAVGTIGSITPDMGVRALPVPVPEPETRFDPVEDRERRIHTRPGIGTSKPPLPKKDR